MPEHDVIELLIEPRTRDLGDLTVRRALPDKRRQRVGPFIFFDHMGPAEFAPGTGINVRAHPHIGLATITYLFEGEILHRDSLGCVQPIRPGAVNWMTAGSGIVHSEKVTMPPKRFPRPVSMAPAFAWFSARLTACRHRSRRRARPCTSR
jgi:redox-sensitive bicupin YhaK (pirin superfamily)